MEREIRGMITAAQKTIESALKKVEAQQENLGGFMDRFDIPEHWAVREALERRLARKPVRKEMPYSEYHGFVEEWRCPTCGAYVGYFEEGMSEPEQMEYCNNCGQHIARDWSDE